MEYLMYYFIFALATAFTALYELINPVMKVLEGHEPENNAVQYKYTTKGTMFLLSILLAPVVFLACVVPSIGESARAGLLTGLRQA